MMNLTRNLSADLPPAADVVLPSIADIALPPSADVLPPSVFPPAFPPSFQVLSPPDAASLLLTFSLGCTLDAPKQKSPNIYIFFLKYVFRRVMQLYSEITRGTVLMGELYGHRIPKVGPTLYAFIFRTVFAKISRP